MPKFGLLASLLVTIAAANVITAIAALYVAGKITYGNLNVGTVRVSTKQKCSEVPNLY